MPILQKPLNLYTLCGFLDQVNRAGALIDARVRCSSLSKRPGNIVTIKLTGDWESSLKISLLVRWFRMWIQGVSAISKAKEM